MWLICQVVGHKVGPWILTPTDVGRLDHGCVRMVSPSRTVVWALCCICSRSWEAFLLMVASAYIVSISLVFCHSFLFERVWWSLQFCQVPTVENGTEVPEEMLLLQCKGQLSCKNTQPNLIEYYVLCICTCIVHIMSVLQIHYFCCLILMFLCPDCSTQMARTRLISEVAMFMSLLAKKTGTKKLKRQTRMGKL